MRSEGGESGATPIERASPNDVVTLATDRGPAPMNIAAVLFVDSASDLDFATVTGPRRPPAPGATTPAAAARLPSAAEGRSGWTMRTST